MPLAAKQIETRQIWVGRYYKVIAYGALSHLCGISANNPMHDLYKYVNSDFIICIQSINFFLFAVCEFSFFNGRLLLAR